MNPKTETDTTRELRLIAPERVAELLGVTRTHVAYLRRADPTFPRVVRLGHSFNSAIRFSEVEVVAWIAARLAAREADTARHRAAGAAISARLRPEARRGGRKRKPVAGNRRKLASAGSR